MPEGRLQRTRVNYLCEMCGRDSLVGSHTREIDRYGSMVERCPTRYSAVFMPISTRTIPVMRGTLVQRTGDDTI